MIASRQELPPKRAEELDGIRIRGFPDSTENEARLRQEHDLAGVQKVLTHMHVNALIGDIKRLGLYDKNKTRRIPKSSQWTPTKNDLAVCEEAKKFPSTNFPQLTTDEGRS